MKCSVCPNFDKAEKICRLATNLTEIDDEKCLLKLANIVLLDILFEMRDRNDEGEEWKYESD